MSAHSEDRFDAPGRDVAIAGGAASFSSEEQPPSDPPEDGHTSTQQRLRAAIEEAKGLLEQTEALIAQLARTLGRTAEKPSRRNGESPRADDRPEGSG